MTLHRSRPLSQSAELKPEEKTKPKRDGVILYFAEDPLEITLLSERALAEDWNRPEEREAWAYLQKYRTH